MKKANVHEAVFVHSSSRTSSTWLWSRFRANEKTVSYSEFFHEDLVRVSQLLHMDYSSWNSRHPATAPYYLEFEPLINETGGVKGYTSDMAYASFFPKSKNLSISDSEKEYVFGLIEHAGKQNKTAVLTCTRSLARSVGLKRAFGGVHIFLFRNMFRQWCSYHGQYMDGNQFFVEQLIKIVNLNSHDKFISKIQNEFIVNSDKQFSDFDINLIVFCLLHLYIYNLGFFSSDLIIYADRLAVEADYRSDIESFIYEKTGVNVDLYSAKNNIDKTNMDVKNIIRCIDLAYDFFIKEFDRKKYLNINFTNHIIEEMKEEALRYEFYTQAITSYLIRAPE